MYSCRGDSLRLGQLQIAELNQGIAFPYTRRCLQPFASCGFSCCFSRLNVSDRQNFSAKKPNGRRIGVFRRLRLPVFVAGSPVSVPDAAISVWHTESRRHSKSLFYGLSMSELYPHVKLLAVHLGAKALAEDEHSRWLRNTGAHQTVIWRPSKLRWSFAGHGFALDRLPRLK